MAWIDRVRRRLGALLRREALEREMDEEMRFHLEMEAEDLVRTRGLSPNEARRQARLAFGGVERFKQEGRDARGTGWLEDTAADAKYAIRVLRKRPGFALAATWTLGIGIGAATTIFGLFDAAYLRALPYPDADRLVALWQDHRDRGGPAEERFNPPDFESVRERSHSLESVAALVGWSPTLTGTDRPERLHGLMVSHEYFGLLGARPVVGRFFSPGDETPAGEHVVVIAHGLWQRRFGADPQVIGRAVELEGSAYTVVGVTPADFRPPGGEVQIWRPIRTDPGGVARRFRMIDVVGRLAPGASVEGARAELDALAAEIAGAYPESNAGVTFRLAPLDERVVGPVRTALLALLGAVALILLLSCANVAGLLLARGAARSREVAVRAALGARRGRVVRQLLAEGLLLGLLGGALGLLLAGSGTHLLSSVLPDDALPGAEVTFSMRAAALALALSVATALAVALVPALRLSDIDVARSLKGGGGHGSNGSTGRGTRARSALVVVEIALSLVLLVGAGLFLKNLVGLLSVDPGFRPEQVLTAELSLPRDRYPDGVAVSRFYERLLGELRHRPGVRAVGAVSFLPLRGGGNDVSLRIDGRPSDGAETESHAWYRIAAPGYFRAMGIPILNGRTFTKDDRADAPGVVIVNDAFARRYWPDGVPIGKRLSPEWADGAWLTVVGVVGDVRHNGLSAGVVPEIYFPYTQLAGAARTMTIVMKTAGDPTRLARELRQTIWTFDPDLPLERLAPMEEILAGSIALPRLHLWTFGTFGVLALLLAAVGLYAVVSTVVALRTQEIGLRLAIGARPMDVMRWVLRRAAVLVLLGVGSGLLGALLLSHALESLLWDLSPTDPATFVGVVALLGAVALLAAWIPARRAAAADPMTVLRAE